MFAMPARAALLAGALTLVCSGPRVAGGIPPSHFKFTNTVPAPPTGPGGWKVAQVTITLGRMTASGPISSPCRVEVGVPEVNHLGMVSTLAAQHAAAAASDAAARIVLGQEGLLSATACDRFRTEVQLLLQDEIPGARVSDFNAQGVPRTTFP